MTIREFNSKIHSSSDRKTLVDALGRFVRVDKDVMSVLEDNLKLTWGVWDPDGLEVVS